MMRYIMLIHDLGKEPGCSCRRRRAASIAELSEDDQSVRVLYIAHTVLGIAGAAGCRNV